MWVQEGRMSMHECCCTQKREHHLNLHQHTISEAGKAFVRASLHTHTHKHTHHDAPGLVAAWRA
jgi:hypothetical protein